MPKSKKGKGPTVAKGKKRSAQKISEPSLSGPSSKVINKPKARKQRAPGPLNGGRKMPKPIVFIDMRERAKDAPQLEEKAAKEARKKLDLGEKENLPNGENDLLFTAARQRIAQTVLRPEILTLTHDQGKLNSQRSDPVHGHLTDNEMLLAGVFGILERDNNIKSSADSFNLAVTAAITEYSTDQALFAAALKALITAGTRKDERDSDREVNAKRWAKIVGHLRAQKIDAENPTVDEVATRFLVDIISSDQSESPSAISIDLPDLEDAAIVEIVEANLQAMQALYFAAMLEELKVFQVVTKLVEQFHYGMLPLSKGDAGDTLFRYWKRGDDTFTELERRNLYVRAFGFPGGDTTEIPNRECNDLWLRFVSGVSSFQRQNNIENLLRPGGAGIPGAVSQEQVRKSGRDLAGNLSLHGYGIAYFAATELQDQIKEIKKLLSDPEIKNAYGARDMWQVVDQVATLELGGAKNSIRYRTMAHAGAVIIRWLANRAPSLASSSLAPVLNQDQIRNQKSAGTRDMVDPTDFDLVNACEQWLAVTGTPEAQVEEWSQPSEAPAMTSRPIQIPAAARDLIESAVSAGGLSYNGQRNGNGNGSGKAAQRQ
jgi:hypothetical protein